MGKICQSCGMPITQKDQLGTNKDVSINNDYCKYCYQNGEFIDKVDMGKYIEMCSQYGEQAGMTNEEMKKYCEKIFPTLKRWKAKQIVWQPTKEYKNVMKVLKKTRNNVPCLFCFQTNEFLFDLIIKTSFKILSF